MSDQLLPPEPPIVLHPRESCHCCDAYWAAWDDWHHATYNRGSVYYHPRRRWSQTIKPREKYL